MTTSVVGVSGSRREGSHTRKAVACALAAAGDDGAETELIDLGAVDLPLYHPDRDDGEVAAELQRLVRRADGVLLGSPTYHRSYSSTFKNFHDYCGSEEYEETVVGLIAVAGGSVSIGGTLNHMRTTVGGVGGEVLARQVGVPNASGAFDGEAFVDPDLRESVEELGRAVHRRARRRAPLDAQD